MTGEFKVVQVFDEDGCTQYLVAAEALDLLLWRLEFNEIKTFTILETSR